MPKAIDAPTTSRRAALQGGFSTLAAGPCASRATAATPIGADAGLIRLCVAIHANRNAVDALLATRVTFADEHRTEPALARLFGTEAAILGQLWEAGTPDTARGAKAVARLALLRWKLRRGVWPRGPGLAARFPVPSLHPFTGTSV